jgi:hypothetical protein
MPSILSKTILGARNSKMDLTLSVRLKTSLGELNLKIGPDALDIR